MARKSCKGIGPQKRFDVFHRDGFACQYYRVLRQADVLSEEEYRQRWQAKQDERRARRRAQWEELNQEFGGAAETP